MTLNYTVPSASMMSVAFFYCYAESRYAECRHAGCRYAEWCGAPANCAGMFVPAKFVLYLEFEQLMVPHSQMLDKREKT